MVNIIDTTPVFMEKAKPDGEISREEIEAYHSRYPEIFNSYFPNHFPPTDERINAALEKYPDQSQVHSTIRKRLTAECVPCYIK